MDGKGMMRSHIYDFSAQGGPGWKKARKPLEDHGLHTARAEWERLVSSERELRGVTHLLAAEDARRETLTACFPTPVTVPSSPSPSPRIPSSDICEHEALRAPQHSSALAQGTIGT
ncbi:hypothetical protein CCHR01_11160 [Colletotrichum chrysophilum]|uniref:Uncharacterized protein n=1 Tax=Colletotrichum chrysophilum TaxID=1836956 RepID=A0AAD9ECM0_9PEZI|nr:hypothetical protein CCHR01_11160 [Colletotrichum chrysophilum]